MYVHSGQFERHYFTIVNFSIALSLSPAMLEWLGGPEAPYIYRVDAVNVVGAQRY